MSIAIDWKFPSGSLGNWEEKNGCILLEPQGGAEQPWFYFLISGVAGREVSFSVPALAGQQHWPISVSYDRIDWVPVDEMGPGPTFKHRFTSNFAIVSLAPPYTNGMLWDLLAWAQRSPHLDIQTLGTTTPGLEPLQLLTISDMGITQDKPAVWLIAREQPIEDGASWLAEGMIRFLISTDATAEKLRQEYVFKVVPLMDFLGVYKSTLTASCNWTDTNDDTDESPAALIKKLIANDYLSSAGIALALSLRAHTCGTAGKCTVSTSTTLPQTCQQAVAELLPWYTFEECGTQAINTFFTHIRTAYPDVMMGEVTTSWFYKEQSIGNSSAARKGQYDLLQEGELLLRAIYGLLGDEVVAGMPPLLQPRLQLTEDAAVASVLCRPVDAIQLFMSGEDYQREMVPGEEVNGYISYAANLPMNELDQVERIIARSPMGAREILLTERRNRTVDGSLS